MSKNEPLAPAKISLIFSGDEYFVHLHEQIKLAQKNIFIESYIFEVDPIGLNLLNVLETAVLRGVQVRLLVDGFGSYTSIQRLRQECQSRGIGFRVYHPVLLGITLWHSFSWKRINRGLLLFRRINKRNHRKMALFDEKTVLMGSFNISKVHSQTYMGSKEWRDSGLIVSEFTSEFDIKNLLLAFHEAWRSARLFRGTNFGSFLRRGRTEKMIHSRFRLNSKTYWRFRLLRDLNRRINSAQKHIYITNAYFLPRKSLLRNLRRASRRGVSVNLLLPEVTDVWFVREASRSLFGRLIKSGIHVFEYKNRVLHAKTLIIDDWATLGSHNLNHRSLNHDLEVEGVLMEKEHLEKLHQQWNLDLKSAQELSLLEIEQMSLVRKLMGRVFYWFRFWL